MLFLVDAKLVLLQSSINDEGGRKYDMRIIAKSIEYFELMRDKPFSPDYSEQTPPESPMREDSNLDLRPYRSLKDSLWFFDGEKTHCWMDVEDLIQSIPASNDRGLRETVSISTDFYPTSIILEKAVILGLDADLVQRRDVSFALFRFNIRVSLAYFSVISVKLTLLWSRLNCFFPNYFVVILPSSILCLHPPFAMNISHSLIFLMRSKSSFIPFSMKRLITHHQPPPLHFSLQSSHFCLPFLLT